tara:strand:- start:769 stop:1134 length:366 start_codon:yes stop_codon:yes gene_type:complete
MSIIAQGTYHRATEGLAEDLLERFAPSQEAYQRSGPTDRLLHPRSTFLRFTTFNPVFGHIQRRAQYQGPLVNGRPRALPNWGAADNGAILLRYMNAFARKIQLCWFNREEQPMACPCPESP